MWQDSWIRLWQQRMPWFFQKQSILLKIPKIIVPLRSFIKRQTSGTSSYSKWQRVVHRIKTSDNKWQKITNSNEWQQMIQRVTANGSKKTKVILGLTKDASWRFLFKFLYKIQLLYIQQFRPFLNQTIHDIFLI